MLHDRSRQCHAPPCADHCDRVRSHWRDGGRPPRQDRPRRACSATPTPPTSPPSTPTACGSRARSRPSPCPRGPCCREDLPPVIDRAVLAVKSHHTRCRGPAARSAGRRRLRPLAAERPHRRRDRGRGRTGRVLVGFVNFGADYLEPGCVLQGNVAAFRVGEPDGAGHATGSARLVDRPPLGRGHRQHRRLPVGQGGLRRHAVRHRRLGPVDRRRARRPALPAADARARPRGAGPGDRCRRSRSTASTPTTSRARWTGW